MIKIILKLCLLAILNCNAQETDFWMPLNVPEGGRVYEFVCSPGNTLYSCGFNGFYHSTNSGEEWELIKLSRISKIAIDSKNNIIASEFNYRNTTIPGALPFLIRSIDNGLSWDTLFSIWDGTNFDADLTYNFIITNVKFDLNDILYVVATERIGNKYFHRLSMSDNLGNDWSLIHTSTSSIRIFPYKDGHFSLIRTITDDLGKNHHIFSITTDNGQSFHDVMEFGIPIEIIYINKQEILALFGYSIQYTDDGGLTWKEIQSLPITNENNFTMILDKNNELFVMTSHYRLLHSSDLGNTWVQIHINSNDYKFEDYRIPILVQDSLKNIYFTHGLGFDKSTDRGKTFHRKSKGFIQSPAQLGFLRLSFDKKGNVYFSKDGVYVSRDNGLSWEHHSFGGSRIEQMLVLNDGNIIAYPNRNTVYRSSDEGRNWDTINTDNIIGDVWYAFSSRIQAPSGSIFVTTAGSNGVFRSRDGGLTYHYIGGQGNENGGKGIAINNEGHIFTVNYQWIYRSTDDGDTWEKVYDFHDHPDGITHNFSNDQYRGIFHPTQPIGYFSIEIDSYSRATVKTTDNGNTWFFDVAIGMAAMAVDSLHNIILNLRRSSDNGETWEEIDSGINMRFNFPVEMGVSSRGYIFIVMEYGGIYRSREAIVSVRDGADKPTEDNILVAPNPFSEKTDVQYYISEKSKVKLSVLDIFGREVIRLVDNIEQSGEHTITLSGNTLHSGVYFLSLHAEGITKTVMLLKY